MLLFLTPHPLDSTDTVITAIEKSGDGTLLFELGGGDDGDWIEWHPEGKQPSSFSGGLDERYELQRVSSLNGEWYLVRYRN